MDGANSFTLSGALPAYLLFEIGIIFLRGSSDDTEIKGRSL